jgi:DNA adenine methylase
MPRAHTLRGDPQLPEIDAALRAGQPVRRVAARFAKSKSAVDRYARAVRQAAADADRLGELLRPPAARNGTTGANGTPAPTAAGPAKGLRIYGGKARLAAQIAAHLPAHTTYVEPFGGMGSVLLAKRPSAREVLNDRDDAVAAFWRVLRDRPDELCLAVRLTPFARSEADLAGAPAAGLPDLELARRLVVLAGQTQHGAVATCQPGWRFETGRARRPHNVGAWVALPERLAALADRLRRVELEHDDGFAVVARFDGPGTCLYVDPPYPEATRGKRWATKGYRHELTDADHVRLAEALQGIAGVAVVSGYDGPLYDALYTRRGWRSVPLGATDQAGTARPETLWFHPRCAESLPHALTLPGLIDARIPPKGRTA